MHEKKLRAYNLIFTTVAFMTILVAMVIAVALNKRQQAFYSEAQNFAKHAAISISEASVKPTALISVLVYADRPTADDWIGLFSMENGSMTPIVKQYLSSCILQQEGTARIGHCKFSVPEAVGVYTFRLFRDGLFITATEPVTVTTAVFAIEGESSEVCTPQPPCLRQTPACVIAEPADGWCKATN